MKGLSVTSAKATASRPPRTGQSSDNSRLSRTSAEGFALTGPSDPPDPATHAYRRDLADAALAHRVIASHYAEPLGRLVAGKAVLKARPSDDSDSVAELEAGDQFEMLDNSIGWAWGYAGPSRLVGYVRSEALKAA